MILSIFTCWLSVFVVKCLFRYLAHFPFGLFVRVLLSENRSFIRCSSFSWSCLAIFAEKKLTVNLMFICGLSLVPFFFCSFHTDLIMCVLWLCTYGGGVCTQSCPALWDPRDCVARRAPLPMEFSRQEYWSRLPFPVQGDLPDLGIEPPSLVSPALAAEFFSTAPPGKPTL